jgi:hypothetical protein
MYVLLCGIILYYYSMYYKILSPLLVR